VSASVGVLFKLPLYSGGALQNRIKETLQLEEKSRDDLEAARRGVVQGTRASFYGVQSLVAQVKALEAAESSSQLALEATQLGYKVGVRVNLDVLNAQTQLFNARRDLAKARYDVLVNGLKLRQAAGQLKPEDVTGVNQLLAK
jgi:outer membrane protein